MKKNKYVYLLVVLFNSLKHVEAASLDLKIIQNLYDKTQEDQENVLKNNYYILRVKLFHDKKN